MKNDVPMSMYVKTSKFWLSLTAFVTGICEKFNKELVSSTMAKRMPCEFVGKLPIGLSLGQAEMNGPTNYRQFDKSAKVS